MNARPAAFTPEKILVMKMRLPAPRYSRAMQQHYRDELLRRLGSIPGVEAAGISAQPCSAAHPRFPSIQIPNRPSAAPELRDTRLFRALGMELRKGRWLTDSEKDGVILLNESMAREAFGSADPIGRTLKVPEPKVVVGVVTDLRYTKLDADVVPEIFLPFDEPMMFLFDIAVRAPTFPAFRRRCGVKWRPSIPAYRPTT